MHHSRRALLKRASAFAALAAVGQLAGSNIALADYNATAFSEKVLANTLKELNATGAVDSPDILIMAPDIAEDGSVVPVEITSSIPNTTRIDILAEQNPYPLIASFNFSNGAEPFIATRVKMGKTAKIRALVITADGKVFTAAKMVKVTAGGCGG